MEPSFVILGGFQAGYRRLDLAGALGQKARCFFCGFGDFFEAMSKVILISSICAIEWTDTGCRTVFDDGSTLDSWPHETPHYFVASHRCGYGDDILSYCRQHDFCHAFTAWKLDHMASPVLFALAHGRDLTPSIAAREECLVQTFQAFLRANQRPIIGNVPWDAWRGEALELLG